MRLFSRAARSTVRGVRKSAKIVAAPLLMPIVISIGIVAIIAIGLMIFIINSSSALERLRCEIPDEIPAGCPKEEGEEGEEGEAVLECHADHQPPDDIPAVLFDSYICAAAVADEIAQKCSGMTWEILAGIGFVESSQLSGRDISESGDVTPPVIGIRLDGYDEKYGMAIAEILDTDDGRWDRDIAYDRAVGPLQFIPTTWEDYGQDGNNDKEKDPHNVYDSARGTIAYLCQSINDVEVDLTDEGVLRDAIFRYNNSKDYVNNVMHHIARYENLNIDTGSGGEEGSPVADMAEIRARAQAYVVASGEGWIDPFYPTGGATYYKGMCAQLAARINGYEASGHRTARVQWDYYVGQGIAHPGDSTPPPGALLFYDTGLYTDDGVPLGHVAIYLGDNQVVSNDIYDDVYGREGGVYFAPFKDFVGGHWNLTYLGWAPPNYG